MAPLSLGGGDPGSGVAVKGEDRGCKGGGESTSAGVAKIERPDGGGGCLDRQSVNVNVNVMAPNGTTHAADGVNASAGGVPVHGVLESHTSVSSGLGEVRAPTGAPVVDDRVLRKDGKCAFDGVLRPANDWDEAVLKGDTISLRNRTKAKDFLRYLAANGAMRHSKAIAVGKRFGKPSSLFSTGARFVRDQAAPDGRDISVENQFGALIHRVYMEGVGKVSPVTKGKGPCKYYLRVYANSDMT